MKIIPTVFSTNKREFNSRLKKLIPVSKYLQIDFMDGKFVKGKSPMPKDIPDLKKYSNSFEAHLMVKNPEKYIEILANKGFKRIIFHYESLDSKDVIPLTKAIKYFKMKPIIAFNPKTKIIEYPHILLMGVNPGKEKQKLLPSTYSKIKQIKKNSSKTIIQVDGGVTINTAIKLKEAGANIINSGSFISEAKNPKKALNDLKHIINN